MRANVTSNVAVRMCDGPTVLAVDWELMNAGSWVSQSSVRRTDHLQDFTYQPNWHYDLNKALDSLEDTKASSRVLLHDDEVHSFLTATYAFEQSEGKVGELCASQLAIASSAIPSAASLTFASVKIEFEGAFHPIILRHKALDATAPPIFRTRVDLNDSTSLDVATSGSTLVTDPQVVNSGTGALTVLPGKTGVFEFSIPFREAGTVRALSATFTIQSAAFDFEYVYNFKEANDPEVWWDETGLKRRLNRPDTASIIVSPKPPKLELDIPELEAHYYINEKILLELQVLNQEDVDSIVDIEVRLSTENALPFSLKWASATAESMSIAEETFVEASLGSIASGASATAEILIPRIEVSSILDLTIKANYHLVTAPATKIYSSRTSQLDIINPFEANYEFSSRIHPDPWPSFFDPGTLKEDGRDDGEAHGLAQKWCLTSRYASFASTELIIDDITVDVHAFKGSIKCSAQRLSSIPEGGLRVVPKVIEEAQFDVNTRKISLDDRGCAALDVSLAINWHRDGQESSINTTSLPVPRLLVSGSEPRVLAASSYSKAIAPMIHFDMVIENPSNHLLTFGLTMDPSEQFAFSGVKNCTLQLVPLCRRIVRFRLLPYSTGDWIGPIKCVVRDKYFQKTLKVIPTEGMKLDKEGILLWVPPEDDA